MKKILLILAASFCLLNIYPNFAAATNPYEDTSGQDICEANGFSDPTLCGSSSGGGGEAGMMAAVGRVLNTVYTLIGVLAVVFVIIGGFKYMTSQGDPGKLSQAKYTVMFSLIGLVISLGAFAITAFILNALGGGGTTGGGGGGNNNGGITALQITSSDTMAVGKTLQLKVKITPSSAEDKELKFKSSDTTVAVVSNIGVITSKHAGTTRIYATANNGVQTSMVLTVTDSSSGGGSNSISLKPTSVTLKVGQTKAIIATVAPSNATVTWVSSDPDIASVDNSGIVTAKKAGTATITAKANGKSATTTVKVEKQSVSYGAVWETRHYTNSNGRGYDYWINVPEGATDNMALVLFLHGDGQKNSASGVAGTAFVQNLHADKGYIGIAPICKRCGENEGDDWASDTAMTALKGLVDTIVNQYHIDTSRIYIWGFSRGSIGTWEMVKRYGSFFRAAVPVSTCGRKTTFTSADGAKFKNTKTYAVVGSREDTSCMQKRVNYINSAGGSAQLKILSGVDHAAMTNSFPYTEIIDNWLLKQ